MLLDDRLFDGPIPKSKHYKKGPADDFYEPPRSIDVDEYWFI